MDRFEKAGKAFERLCRVMARLRGPGGCPWDREQTLDSLKPYLIEETYEVLDAIDSGDPASHREELGDLLLQVVFQAELTREQQAFDAAAVADAISDKLVRRHPHVFGEVEARDSAGALESWEGVKARERGPEGSRLAGIPRTLPALLRATRTGEKAAAIGFDWPDTEGVRAKVVEEWRELGRVLEDGGDPERTREELGDLLYALVNLSRHLGVDAEVALREATEKFARRFHHIERRLAELDDGSAAAGHPKPSLEQLDRLWEEAKALERSATGQG